MWRCRRTLQLHVGLVFLAALSNQVQAVPVDYERDLGPAKTQVSTEGKGSIEIGNRSNQVNNVVTFVLDAVSLQNLSTMLGDSALLSKKTNGPTEYDLAREDVEINQRWMMYAALTSTAALIVTSGLLIWNACQLQRANRQGKQMVRQSFEAARAARESVQAAEKNLEIAHDTRILEFKPYLRVSKIHMDSIVDAHELLQSFFTFTIENIGRSQATQLHDFKVFQVGVQDRNWTPESLVKPNAKISPDTLINVLNPGDSVNVPVRIIYNEIPKFGIDIEPCYQLFVSFKFFDISTEGAEGKARECIFQLQKTPKYLSQTRIPAEEVETIEKRYLYSDKLVQVASSK